MDRETLAASIDHTVLGTDTTPADVSETLKTAEAYGMNACIPPCYVREATRDYPGLEVVTVVGFPHGQHTPESKAAEAAQAQAAGAGEVDVVQNVGRLLAGEHEAVRADIHTVVTAVDIPVKVILETALLERSTLETAADVAREAGAEFLKTSTGFADTGANADDVAVMAEYLPVKASGGIHSWPEASDLFEAGATRIGTSAGDLILEEFETSP